LVGSKHPKDPTVFRSGFAEFQINLRADDRPVLELIQSYLGCGRFTIGKPRPHDRRPNPLLNLCVSRVGDLWNVVVPHFERHPLYAKKSRDFAIWCRGVELLYRIAQRPRRAKRGGAGRLLSWAPEELAEFTKIMEALRDVRRFDGTPTVDLPASGLCSDQGLLFGP
jgi:hypothetical protein